MAISYSQCAPLSEALRKTFDGDHPCELCKVVQNGRKAAQKQSLSKLETRLDFLLTQSPPLLYPPPPVVIPASTVRNENLRIDPPPTPPPRTA
jgi:hypothetical protein